MCARRTPGTQPASTISDFSTVTVSHRLDQFAAPTAAVSLNGQKITNLGTPTVGTDATTKTYVDTGDTAAKDRANHTGTQLAATISNFDTQVRTSRLDQMAVPTAPVAMNGQKITGLADPTADQDAATKLYTDVRAGSTAVLDGVPVGTIVPYGGAAAPSTDWMLCQGQSLLRTDYAALFTAIGTTYGSADGTHFTLPNLQGRTPIGAGTGTATDATLKTLGSVGGTENHTLTVGQMPSHAHTVSDPGHAHSNTNGAFLNVSANVSTFLNTTNNVGYAVFHAPNTATAFTGITTVANGGGASHPNMQPYLVTNYIIKVSARAPQGMLLATEAAPVGTVVPYAGATAPTVDWLLCDGSSVLRTDYAELFTIIGTAYGSVDGTHFNLPDMRGRVPVGAGTGVGEGSSGTGKPTGTAFSARAPGDWGGEVNHTLLGTEAAQKSVTTNSENATHVHGPGTNYAADQGSVWGYITNVTYGAALIYLNSASSGSQSANHQHTITAQNAALGHNTMQPYIVTNYIIRARSVTPQKYSLLGDLSPIGSVTAFAGATLPTDWLLCDGSSLLRTDYPELFTVIGTTWGSADATHFNLPDLRGRTLVGSGTGTGGGAAGTGLPTGGSALTARALGQWLGEETHVLSIAEMPSHAHPNSFGQRLINSAGVGNTGQPPGGSATNNGVSNDQPLAMAAQGGSGAHNTMPPSTVVTWIIKAKQTVATATTGNSSKSRINFTADGVVKTFTLRHTLSLAANEPYIAQVWEADGSGNPVQQAVADVRYSDFQNVSVVFGTAPANGKKYILTVLG